MLVIGNFLSPATFVILRNGFCRHRKVVVNHIISLSLDDRVLIPVEAYTGLRSPGRCISLSLDDGVLALVLSLDDGLLALV